jgi:glycosyltransferase involved in cell wall biosynthesis
MIVEENKDVAVSVVIPAYRVTAYVARAVESALCQTLRPREVIVVNDGCPDSDEQEAALQPFMNRVTYVRRPNGGPAAARNTGVRTATGSLIAFLDADDYWDPEFLESQVTFMQTQGIDLAYADALLVRDGRVTGRTWMQGVPSRGAATLDGLLTGRCTVMTSTVVARKDVLIGAGLFHETTAYAAEDFDLWCRVAYSGGRIGYQRRPLAFHRIHGESLTADPRSLLRGAVAALDRLGTVLNLEPRLRSSLNRQYAFCLSELHAAEAKAALLDFDYELAREKLRQSVVVRPSSKRRLAMLALRAAPSLVRRAYVRRLGASSRRAGAGRARAEVPARC